MSAFILKFFDLLMERMPSSVKLPIRRWFLHSKEFSIVSDNCWGGFVYQHFGLKYRSPFVGLFIFSDDYIKLISKLEFYMSKNLVFIEHSESIYAKEIKDTIVYYPIARLVDIEIHFLHYKDNYEAETKWNKRKLRINYDNIIIKMCDRDLFSPSLLQVFSGVDRKKIFLTSKKYNFKWSLKLQNENGHFVENEWRNFKRTASPISIINQFYK